MCSDMLDQRLYQLKLLTVWLKGSIQKTETINEDPFDNLECIAPDT